MRTNFILACRFLMALGGAMAALSVLAFVALVALDLVLDLFDRKTAGLIILGCLLGLMMGGGLLAVGFGGHDVSNNFKWSWFTRKGVEGDAG